MKFHFFAFYVPTYITRADGQGVYVKNEIRGENVKDQEKIEESVLKCENIEKLRQIKLSMFENRRKQWSCAIKVLL